MKSKHLKNFKYLLLYVFVRYLIWVACILPRGFVMWWFGLLGNVSFHVLRGERTKAIRHLKTAYRKSKTEAEYYIIAKNVFINAGKNIVDVLRFPTIKSLQDYRKIVKTEGEEHFEKAYKQGKGVIGLTCHMGAFEIVGTFPQFMGYEVTIVGTTLRNNKLDDLLVRNRTLRGSKYIARGKDTIKLIRALKSGESVMLLIDQNIPKVKSVFVDFFGIPAATPIGATVLAMRTDAIVIPIGIRRMKDDTHLLQFKPPIELIDTGNYEEDLVSNTQLFINELEAFIREDPAQWLWMHKRWKTRPENEKLHPSQYPTQYSN
jgi:KDO2-lipid IV(A) lauroyltransferase